MRVWSLHPALLDRQGLTACWREGLLAQAVLAGRTKGYLRHPQLERFREQPDPLASIGAYLAAVADEADARGYRYDRTRIDRPGPAPRMVVTDGQLEHELQHLRAKLAVRSPDRLPLAQRALPHPLFEVETGGIASWERVTDAGAQASSS